VKKILAIIVLAIFGWLTFFIWPTQERMVDYCTYKNLGLQNKYRDINLNIKLDELGQLYVSGVIECGKKLKENSKLFKSEYLIETGLARLNTLF
jgi:hypothetical protein